MKFLKNIFLFLLLASFPLFGESYEDLLIEEVCLIAENVRPGMPFNMDVTLNRLGTKKGCFFSEQQFDQDLKAIAGDFDRIEPYLEKTAEGVKVTLVVSLKPRVRRLFFEGNCRLDSTTLRQQLDIKPGVFFDRREFLQAFHKLQTYYVKQGFFEAELDYEIICHEDLNEVDIHVKIQEGRAGKISRICFEGFSSDEEYDVLSLMVTQKYNFFTSWWTGAGIYQEDAIQHDEFIILNYLQNKGYLDAVVNISVEEDVNPERIVVVIRLNRGECYYFGEVKCDGFTVFCEDDLFPLITATPGSPFSVDLLREAAGAITDLYGRKGYIDAIVDFNLQLNRETRCYDVCFQIEEGRSYSVGMIKIFGNCTTHARVILHETLFVPGEKFNSIKLKKTQERLTNIGFFKNVNVYAVPSESSLCLGEEFRDVHIEVEETSTGNLSASFGYSTQESLFGGFSLTEKNFNITGIQMIPEKGLCCLRGAGEYFQLGATLGTKSRSYNASWTKPYIFDSKWTLGVDLETSTLRYISKDYVINAHQGSVLASYEINPFLRFSWHYRLKNSDIDPDHDASKQLREEAKVGGIISATGVSLLYDSTDHPVFPRDGLRSRLDLEVAGLGGHQFVGFAYTNSYYYSLSPCTWFHARYNFRFIDPYGHTDYETIPIDERLFLGGTDLIRGYRPYKLGPRYEDGDPRGGLSEQFYSLELTRHLFQNVDAFIFFDAGSLTAETWDFGRLYMSAGYGLKVQIFPNAPPIMFGMGYPINPQNRGEIKRFFVTLGGKF